MRNMRENSGPGCRIKAGKNPAQARRDLGQYSGITFWNNRRTITVNMP